MSIVSLLGIKVLSNPAKFTDPYEFEITFECLEQLKDDLEWYVLPRSRAAAFVSSVHR